MPSRLYLHTCVSHFGNEHLMRGSSQSLSLHIGAKLTELLVEDDDDVKDISERELEVFEAERRRAMIADLQINIWKLGKYLLHFKKKLFQFFLLFNFF